MKFKITILLWLVLFTITSCIDHHPKADLVIFNCNIHTLNPITPKAEAVVVVDGKIVYVGNNVNANNWVADTTQILDLKGKTLIPGFIEGHGHIMQLGLELLDLDLSAANSFEDVIALTYDESKKFKRGSWIIGRGWHQDKWDSIPSDNLAGMPIHDRLTSMSQRYPVILYHADRHAVLVNKRALKLAKITNTTPNPLGGEIIRNEKGEATGVLTDNAVQLVESIMPKRSDQDIIEALNMAIEVTLKNGITSFQQAGASQKTINLFHSFLKNGLLKIRMYVMIDGRDENLVENWLVHGTSIGLEDGFLTVRAIKLFADGALGSRNALLFEEYSDAPGIFGLPVNSANYIMKISEDAYKKGFQICTHAIGDKANHEILDIYEIILKSDTSKTNPRFRIEHAQNLIEQDVPRFGKLGIIPSIQAVHVSSDQLWAKNRLGGDRLTSRSYLWQSLISNGATLMNGTDVPTENMNPIANFYVSVTRKTLDSLNFNTLTPQEAMTRVQALESMTINSAYGAFEENIKGTIEIGKLADFTVLSQDILNVPEDQILKTEIDYTIVNGKVMYKK